MSKRSAQRHRQERRELERRDDKFEAATTAPIAISDETRALDALAEIVERKAGKDESVQPRFSSPTTTFASVFRWALTAMANEPGSRASTRAWDAWYRAYAAKEPFLSGVLNSAVAIDKNRGWTLTGGRNQVAKYTKRLHDVDAGAGWRTYIDWQSQSYYTTRAGFVTELGREGRGGPLYTLWSVDPCRVELTGNTEKPLRYYPSRGAMQEWTPDMYLRGKSLVSTDEATLDYGYPAVARCYELAKIMVGVYSHYQQKVGTKTPDGVLTGKFIGEEQWNEAVIARAESLRADPDSYLNSIATIMSSGGDMPEFALTLLSSMPDRWDIDTWTLILMRGYALAFGYQSSEFYPEPAGVMGRGKEQEIQQRSATGKGGKDFALAHQEQIQSVLPPTLEFAYEERDVTGEQADAQLKLAKAQIITEMTKWLVNTQSVLTSEQVLQLAAQEAIIPEDWTPTEEDVTATDEDAPDSERVYRACVMFPDEPIVRYSWPSGKRRVIYRYGADRLIPRFVVRNHQYLECTAMPAPIPQATTTTPLPSMQPMTFNIAPPSVSVQPHVSVTLPEQHAAPVNITMPERAISVNVPERAVNVNVPQQPAPVVNISTEPPIVNVDAPIINVQVPEQQRLEPPIVNVNVPQQERQAPPIINVQVPEQPAPVVNIAPPDVTVTIPDIKLQAGSIAKVKRDYTGKIIEITSNAQVSGNGE